MRVILLSLLLFTASIYSQSGGWFPEGADTTYPRTLLKSSDIPGVINSLGKPAIKKLFKDVYDNSVTDIPEGNDTDAERIKRSHIAKNAAFVFLLGKKIAGEEVVDLNKPVEYHKDSLLSFLTIHYQHLKLRNHLTG